MTISQKNILLTQSAHLFLSAVWNIVGVVLIANNQMALGPTASIKTALFLILFIGLIYLTIKRFPKAYILISAFILAGAFSAILPAFFGDPNIWPSTFWRFSGVALNTLGVIGAVLGISVCLNSDKPR